MASGPESRGTVLIVDDDQILAELLAMSLGRSGFNTVSAVDAAGALALIEQTDDICAAVCDFELGRDNGAQLLSDLHAIDASIVRILMSGHTDSRVPSDLREGVVFFQKPFAAARLVQAILDASVQ